MTSYFSRYQNRTLHRSTEHVEIVPQETCVHHESPEAILTECATISTSKGPVTKKMSLQEVSQRRVSETPPKNTHLKV